MVDENKKILVVEDDQNMRIALFETLSAIGYSVTVAENGQMALSIVQKDSLDLIISDIKMPGMDGLEFLQKVKLSHPHVPVVMVTAFATVDSAVEAMKRGAFDYILKPFPLEVVVETAQRVFAQKHQLDSAEEDGVNASSNRMSTTSRPRSERDKKKVIGQEPVWQKMIERAKAVASSTATILILGESGTGKEVVARFIHKQGERKQGPFVALNCAALPDGLLESELFGHEKGAFTGAVAAKKGKFELADGGTLLLDEIGEVPMHLQAKLLRVLQESEVDRLGGKAPIKFDVHILATTNRNLNEAVEKGEFRQDLFYRLNVIPLRLPSLKERGKDILLLADHFVKAFSIHYKRDVKKMSHFSMQRFMEYNWPGNVREMENMIERAVLLSSGQELEPWDLWDEQDSGYVSQADHAIQTDKGLNNKNDADPYHATVSYADQSGSVAPLREVERQMIIQALQQTDNNRTHAAKMLGISVRTLRNKLHEYRNKGLIA